MSTVFLATDTVLERSVAVKLLAEHLAEDEAFVIRFRNEALAAARLQHPNVVQVFDSGEDGGSHRHYIVMEYVEGPSCADLLREHKLLDIEDSVRIVERRLPRARATPTAPAWCTATSSRATCWWPTRPAPPSWPTSASPRRPSRPA